MQESTSVTEARSAALEVFVDFALVGWATEFPIVLLPSERAGLEIGSEIRLTGDSIDDQFGWVTEFLDEPWVMVRIQAS